MTTDFPTGAKLDQLILWLVGEMARIAPEVEAWTSVVSFYALRECNMLDFDNDPHYRRLVARSLDRLRAAGWLIWNEHEGWRPRVMEGL